MSQIEKNFMRLTMGPITACILTLPTWLASFAIAGGGTPIIDAPLTWSESIVGASSGMQRGVADRKNLRGTHLFKLRKEVG